MNNKQTLYRVFGLIIKSEIIMPELESINNPNDIKHDVCISYGMVPRRIKDAVVKAKDTQISEREMYFYADSVAHFYVGNGNMIIVEPEKDAKLKDIKVYLLGGCIGKILDQRNIIALHGGSVVINNKGIIICGPAGAGKSTLTTGLRIQGYSLLSDDISALSANKSGNIMINYSYAQQKLCRDALEKMGYDVNGFEVIDESRDKYAVPVDDNFIDYEVPLAAIYEINIGRESKAKIEEIMGSKKVDVVLKNLYWFNIKKYFGINQEVFKQCIDIAKTIRVYKLIRPKDRFTVNEQISLIDGTLHDVRAQEADIGKAVICANLI